MASKTDKQPLHVRIGKRTITKLRHQAAQRDISLGELVRRIFDDWLEHVTWCFGDERPDHAYTLAEIEQFAEKHGEPASKADLAAIAKLQKNLSRAKK